jgi:hypothetical protein
MEAAFPAANPSEQRWFLGGQCPDGYRNATKYSAGGWEKLVLRPVSKAEVSRTFAIGMIIDARQDQECITATFR